MPQEFEKLVWLENSAYICKYHHRRDQAHQGTFKVHGEALGKLVFGIKGLFTYHISRERGKDVWQMLTIADEGRRGGKPKADNC